MDHLAPPPDLRASAREIFRLWSPDLGAHGHARYAPEYDAVYFEDSDGLKFEVVHMPEFPT